MLKKTFIAGLLFNLAWSLAFAQQGINAPALTDVLPPAPNAFETTKYAGLPANMSSGSVSASIPLGEISAGRIKVGVNLSYNSGNGVRINQIASRAGTGWVINAGGVISRSVAGVADENSTWLPYPANTTGSDYRYFLYNATSGTPVYDTQTDVFSFDFNGYSGQFILDPAQRTKAVPLAATNLKIETNFHQEISTEDWTIRITDPEGTKYYFGGTTATETSKTVPQGNGDYCGKNFNSPNATAWYLTRVLHYSGEQILLTYQPITFDYVADVSQTLIRTPQATLTTNACVGTPAMCSTRTESQVCGSSLRSNGFILSTIAGPFSNVSFQYADRLDVPGDKLLSGVVFYSKNLTSATSPKVLKSYDLAYIYGYNNSYTNPFSGSFTANRPYLKSVTKGNTGVQAEVHRMNYYNINQLAGRLSYAQDYWGYFNGVNNTYLVPTSPDPTIAGKYPSGMADRTPNGAYSYYGLLSKITYPSYGSDSLQYEPNTVYETRVPVVPRTYITKTATGTNNHDEVSVSQSFTSSNAPITISMSCTYSGTGIDDQIHQHAIVEILYASNNQVLWTNQINIGQTYSGTIPNASGGNFILKVRSFGAAAVSSATVNYQPVAAGVTANYQVGGVRLARNITTALTGKTLIKKYVYAALETQTQSSGRIMLSPNNADYYGIQKTSTCPGGLCEYYIASSNPNRSLNFYSGGHVVYKQVTELQGDQWANGGIEHEYLYTFNNYGQIVAGDLIPGTPVENRGFTNGTEKRSSTFFVTGGSNGAYTWKVVKNVATHYVNDPRLSVYYASHVVRKNYEPGFPDQASTFRLDAFDVSRYNTYVQWIYPDTVTTTSYDLAGNNPVVSYQASTYGNPAHLQVTEQSTEGSDKVVQRVVVKYPHDMVADGAGAPYPAMVAANLLEKKIEQHYYKSSTFLQAVKTDYGDWGNQVFEPASIQTKAAGGNWDTRVVFSGYGTGGGLLSQSKYLGPKNSYVWGYGGLLLVAEAKNAAANEIFYEGFEYNTLATAAYAHTGSLSYSGDYPVPFTPPAGKNYFISWYELVAGKWVYKKEAYAGSKTFAAGVYRDDICIYPTDALMSFYTFDPAVGVTGITDVKGETSYFEYDNFQRLANVRDQWRNIVKNYQYNNRVNAPANVYYNALQSQTFTKSCTVGVGSTVTYQVYAGTYSSAVSQQDANDQALADIAANGQNYANSKGTCATGTRPISFVNATNPPTGTKTSGITSIKLKNAAGTVLYSYTQSQVNAGIEPPVGTYNIEIETFGSAYNFSTQLGWSNLSLHNQNYSVDMSIQRSTSTTIHTFSNVDLSLGISWAIVMNSINTD